MVLPPAVIATALPLGLRRGKQACSPTWGSQKPARSVGVPRQAWGPRPITRRANCQVRLCGRGTRVTAWGTDSCHTAVSGILVRAKGPLRSLSADGKLRLRESRATPNLPCIREKRCQPNPAAQKQRTEHWGGAARKPVCRCPSMHRLAGSTCVLAGPTAGCRGSHVLGPLLTGALHQQPHQLRTDGVAAWVIARPPGPSA